MAEYDGPVIAISVAIAATAVLAAILIVAWIKRRREQRQADESNAYDTALDAVWAAATEALADPLLRAQCARTVSELRNLRMWPKEERP